MPIVMVAAEKGGVGKSSTAVNLAAIARSRGIDVILFDGDTTGSSSSWSRIRAESGIEPSIPVVTLDWRAPQTAPVLVSQLAAKHDLTVIDVGARSYDVMLRCALLADLMLVPVSPGQFEVESTAQLFQQLRQIDVKHRRGRVPAYVLLNMLSTNAKASDEQELREYMAGEGSPIPVMKSVLRHRKAWSDASRLGLALHELKVRGSAQLANTEMAAVYAEAEELIEKELGDDQHAA